MVKAVIYSAHFTTAFASPNSFFSWICRTNPLFQHHVLRSTSLWLTLDSSMLFGAGWMVDGYVCNQTVSANEIGTLSMNVQ
jgi:hypothetical protein